MTTIKRITPHLIERIKWNIKMLSDVLEEFEASSVPNHNRLIGATQTAIDELSDALIDRLNEAVNELKISVDTGEAALLRSELAKVLIEEINKETT